MINHLQYDDIQKVLMELCSDAQKEDSEFRNRQLRAWKKNDRFWHGVQQIFWSSARQEWLSATDATELGWTAKSGISPEEYDYVINIYRAHGESIIAALSAQTPVVRFPPDDADNEEDVIASVAMGRVADLVARHNQTRLLQFQGLLALWNQGLVAAYHCSKQDKSYGEYQISQFKTTGNCAQCGGSQELETAQLERQPRQPIDETEPPAIEGSPDDPESQEFAPVNCQNCAAALQLTHELVGFTNHIKAQTMIDVFGPLNVKVPRYARSQRECGYLIFYQELSVGQIYEMYQDLLSQDPTDLSTSDGYERGIRASSTFSGTDASDNLITLARTWLRPSRFYELGPSRADLIKQLISQYPDGCMVAMAGTTLLDVQAEELDEFWTLGQAGLSRFIHSDPIGQPLIPIQEMTNTLANLTQETIEHGIPSMYADPETLDFFAAAHTVSRPGMITPVTRTPGERISDSFHTGDRAVLSKEVGLFQNYLEKMGQFVTSAFPSLFGGDSKSRTASEYSQSRQQALQRLSIAWTMYNHWYAKVMHKSAKIFVANMVTDEKFTSRQDDNYVTTWIKRAELVGRVGDIEPEGAETFPATIGQKQSLILKLMEMGSEDLNAAIFDVSNRGVLSNLLGFPEFKIPGQDQRTKQGIENQMLLKGEQVMPIPDVDDDDIHIQVCRALLVSIEGIQMQRTNPQGFQAILMHMQAHKMNQQMQMMQEMQAQGATQGMQDQGGPPPGPAAGQSPSEGQGEQQ